MITESEKLHLILNKSTAVLSIIIPLDRSSGRSFGYKEKSGQPSEKSCKTVSQLKNPDYTGG